ncbi:small nuclear ribonucleoprotein [Ordospora colligata]|nr:small nuclear ribonucleoprotein [Ordospora colligata]
MKLIRLLRKCRNEGVEIETKDKRRIAGTVRSVDKQMNVELSDAIVEGKHIGSYNIRGSSIRYIIFRENIDFKQLLIDDRPRVKTASDEKNTEEPKRRKTQV